MTAMSGGMRAQAGYTLVEMVVVLALLGIVALLASGGLQFAGRAQERASAGMRDVRAVAAAQQTMRRFIGNASIATGSEVQVVSASGTAQEFRFASDPRGSAGITGRVAVALRIVERDRRSWLAVTLSQYGASSAAINEEIGPLPAGLQFAYGEIGDAGDVSWATAWTQTERLPTLVRVAPANANSEWPDFIAMVRKNEPPGCRYDPVSRGCRS